MKTASLITAFTIALCAATVALGEEPVAAAPAKEGCKMMKKEPAPEPACSCSKAKSEEKAPDLSALVEKLKTAKGDDTLSAFAAVLNEIVAERKGASDKPAEAPAAAAPAEAHHH